MKALVKYGKGKGMVEIREVPEPGIKEDEVLVEVKAASICGSDLHIWHDRHPYWPPVIMGHEFSGVIALVGERVKGWKAGDRIVTETRTGACGTCFTCQSGYPQVCEQKRAFGIGINGAFGRVVAVPAKLLHRLPESISFEAGAIMEPIAVCATAIFERSAFQAGNRWLSPDRGRSDLFLFRWSKRPARGWRVSPGRNSDQGFGLKRPGK